MLWNIRDLEKYSVFATDGSIGEVKDFYFDDVSWVVRYLVVDTGNWHASRNVLVPRVSMIGVHSDEKKLDVSLTKEQVKNSPFIDIQKSISRQHEMLDLGYYGYTYYWQREETMLRAEEARRPSGDQHLRSCNALLESHIEATDGGIGYVQGFLVDDRMWAIRYMIVDTSNWWSGHSVLIAPEWIDDLKWLDATVSVNVSRQTVKDAPPYLVGRRLDREHEVALHKHYERAGYWTDEVDSNGTTWPDKERV